MKHYSRPAWKRTVKPDYSGRKKKLFVVLGVMLLLLFCYAVYDPGWLVINSSPPSTASQGVIFDQMENDLTGAVIGVAPEEEVVENTVIEPEALQTNDLAVQANCGNAYAGSGNWRVNSTISCSNEAITVTGSLLIVNDSTAATETTVTSFNTAATAVYDLRGNSSTILNAVPNLQKTETKYTADWDTNATKEFYIMMNETENKIQIFSNITDFNNYVYGVDLDGSQSSGSDMGGGHYFDILLGYMYDGSGFLGPLIWCFNQTVGEDSTYVKLVDGADTSAGSYEINTANADANLTKNYTVYWNLSNSSAGTAMEIVVDVTGAWNDKLTAAIVFTAENQLWYTNFTNSTIGDSSTLHLGNLTLNNVTLFIQNNLTVNTNTYLTLNNSNLTFNGNNNNSRITLNTGSTVTINHSNFQTNNTAYAFGFFVNTGNFLMENSVINNLLQLYDGAMNGVFFESESDGAIFRSNTILNNTIGRTHPDDFVVITIDYNAINVTITNNNITTDEGMIYLVSDNCTIANNYVQRLYLTGDYNRLTNNTLYDELFLGQPGSNDNIFLNNILLDATILDYTNSSDYNWWIYNNSYGQIKWYLTNASLGGLSNYHNFSVGNNLYVENNLLGLIDNSTFQKFNTSAQLEFYGLGYAATPQLLKNGVRCDNTAYCNISYNTGIGTLLANVSSFSNYTTQDASVNCSTLTASTTMMQDLSSNTTCFTIDADNIVLDCAGHRIYGNGTGTTAFLISIDGYSNVTIKNCILEYAVNGINISSTNWVNITNNTIKNFIYSGATEGEFAGILLRGSNNSYIINNNITNFTGAGPSPRQVAGIGMTTSACQNLTIANNYISEITITNGTATLAQGITTDSHPSTGIRVYNNVINKITCAVGGCTYGLGIVDLPHSGSDNVYYNNNITNSMAGIVTIFSGSSNISGNIVINSSIAIFAGGLGYYSQNKIIDNNQLINSTTCLSLNSSSYLNLTSNTFSGCMEDIHIIADSNAKFLSALDLDNIYIDSSNVTFVNLTLGNTFTASAEFLSLNIILSGMNTTKDVVVLNNSLYINSTGSPGLNATANLTFTGVSYASTAVYTVLKDGVACSDCVKISANPVRFQVAGFSNYSTAAVESSSSSSSSSSGGGGGSSSRKTVNTTTVIPTPVEEPVTEPAQQPIPEQPSSANESTTPAVPLLERPAVLAGLSPFTKIKDLIKTNAAILFLIFTVILFLSVVVLSAEIVIAKLRPASQLSRPIITVPAEPIDWRKNSQLWDQKLAGLNQELARIESLQSQARKIRYQLQWLRERPVQPGKVATRPARIHVFDRTGIKPIILERSAQYRELEQQLAVIEKALSKLKQKEK